jgi:hypothetical protein
MNAHRLEGLSILLVSVGMLARAVVYFEQDRRFRSLLMMAGGLSGIGLGIAAVRDNGRAETGIDDV